MGREGTRFPRAGIPFDGMGSRKLLALATVVVVVLSGAIIALLADRRGQSREIEALQGTIAAQAVVLREKEDASKNARPALSVDGKPANRSVEPVGTQPTPHATAGSYEILKELEADSPTDPRNYAQKLQQLLADDPTEEQAAIACRSIFNKATDSQALPDHELQAIYASQANPDLKRVIAQVMSMRGNDVLLNDQVAEAQAELRSEKPWDRLDALNQLAKIHHVRAVDVITPLLQDSDSTVRVAALFALRDSGNQRHAGLVEPMTRDPDPSVSNLAGNVLSALRNLSTSAHTSYSRADIESELPPIANP
jgi:hypothetical protein